jgi:hypothetical protein
MIMGRDKDYEFIMSHRWFHGTNERNARKILKEGFKIDEGSLEADLGFGVYLTFDLYNARYYASSFRRPAVIEVSFPDECISVKAVGELGTAREYAEENGMSLKDAVEDYLDLVSETMLGIVEDGTQVGYHGNQAVIYDQDLLKRIEMKMLSIPECNVEDKD